MKRTLSSLLIAFSLGSSAIAQIELQETWSYSATGNRLNILEVHQAPGEYPMIFASGHAETSNRLTYWHALSFDPSTSNYISRRSSRYYDNPNLLSLDVADILAAAGDEIVVYMKDGSYEILDRMTWEVLAFGQSTILNPDSAATQDINLDGFADMVISSGSGGAKTEAIDGSGQILFTLGDGNSRMAIGNVDADPAMELVLEDAVYDLGNLAAVVLQWDYPSRFGAFQLADYDHDGMQEIIAQKFGNTILFYDVDLQTETTVAVIPPIQSFNVLDVDGDGDTEILTSHFILPSELIAWDAETMLEEWRFDVPDSHPVNMYLADFDLDGATELLWLSGTGSGLRKLQVMDWVNGAVEWESTHVDGPFIGAELGDLDGDGIDELVTASKDSSGGSYGGRILVLDPTTGKLLGMSDPVGPPVLGGSEEIFDLRLRDVDQDGSMEIVVGTDWFGSGSVEIYSYAAGVFTLDWINVDQPWQSPLAAVEVADVDGDGTLEVLATVADHPNTLVDDNFLYIFDFATGLEEFRSAEMGTIETASTGLEVGDFDQDGALEIAVMVKDGGIYIYDGLTYALEDLIAGQHRSLSTIDYAGNTYLMAGTVPGDVVVYAKSGGSYQWAFSKFVGNSPVEAAHAFQVGTTSYLFHLSASIVEVAPLGAPNALWTTSLWGPDFARDFQFSLAPAPGFFATSDHGIHFFSRQ